ncbi:MAG TPA: ATP-binding protein [Chloroflexota bacterium]|nr:ATP-binding protein [Chloroflexota bacterium]
MAAVDQNVGEADHLTADVLKFKVEQDNELEEIESLIRQTSAEIDHLQPERNDISRKLREMESNIEQFSRTDIRRMYNLVQEASMRLFMMQSQLEQLQYKQKLLQRSVTVFEKVLSTSAALATIPVEPTPMLAMAGPDLARAVIAGREVERRALAHQLHDFTAQLLASLVLRAQICERAVEVDQARAREELRLLREALADRLQSTRLLIFELHPQVLDDLGLVPTIRRYLQLVERLGAPMQARQDPAMQGTNPHPTPTIEVSTLGSDRRYPHPIEIGSYRVVQEAVRNAIRHARASRIVISVEDQADHLSLAISDDGKGFDSSKALATALTRRVGGLADLLAEADALGATLAVTSEPGHGAQVSLTVPL